MERFWTFLWLLLVPTQLGKHFWLTESYVAGIKVDYLSIILYLTDMVWLGWVFSLKKERKKNKIGRILAILLVILVNVWMAEARWVAVYRWLKMGQWVVTVWLVAENKEKIKEILLKVVPIWILMEVFLAVSQVAKGGSLEGIWYWLGERRFSFGSVGIAQMRWGNEATVRAYGSFSHPNSLAGFLLLAWVWWKEEIRNKKPASVPPERDYDVMRPETRIWYWVVNWSAILGIILTGSRTVWVLTLLIWILETKSQKPASVPPERDYGMASPTSANSGMARQETRRILGRILVVLGVGAMVLGLVGREYELKSFLGGWDSQGWQKRMSLNMSALKMIADSPIIGVGAGNFTKRLSEYQKGSFYWLQPVHNILLLALSETGIVGVIILGSFLKGRLRKINWWMVVIIMVTGLVDHYWLTLPQNTWLLAIILGILG